MVGLGNRWDDYGIADVLALTVSLVALHPIGFVIGPIWLMDRLWFAVFLAWLIKACILNMEVLAVIEEHVPCFSV